MENKVSVYIKVWGEGRIPQYASSHAAGCDLYATMDMAVRPGETKIMPLDFSMAIDAHLEAQIRPRSGLSLRTELRLPNSPGTIDSDYRDTVGIILQNTYNIANLPYQIAANPELLDELRKNYEEVDLGSYLGSHYGIMVPAEASPAVLGQKIYIDKHGNPYGTIYIKKGERIAQMVFSEYRRAEFIPHPDPRSIGEDRGGGFGHTGSR
ncbi:MAG TPA: aminotransferase [Clostridiales bacterium]|nr:aminotransferase [Clostridiales bacterium]HPV02125.1 aminotransferase [Clostridiales bacterium]